jgi:hypothetical protein
MKKSLLIFFILLIFNQLAFSQSEVWAECYRLNSFRENLFGKTKINISDDYVLKLNQDGSFSMTYYEGCFNNPQKGVWKIYKDTLHLNYEASLVYKDAKYLIIGKRLKRINPHKPQEENEYFCNYSDFYFYFKK